jgi:dihydropteroate synthase
MAIAYGADIVRVHDVRQHVEACGVADAIKGHRP